MDEIYKDDSSISHRLLFQTTQLTRMNEVIRNRLELKSFTNDFLNEFAYCIEENDVTT